MTEVFNQLEPQALVDAFLRHPPEDFILNQQDGITAFNLNFNLLVPLDASLRKKIQNLYAYSKWKKVLQPSGCLIGTTVSEYTPIQANLAPETAIKKFKQLGQKQTLTIVKDIPINSPLISAEENTYNQKLTQAAKKYGFSVVEGQALAYVHIDFQNRDEYLARLSKSRRKNLKRKLKSLEQVRVECLPTGDHCFLNVEFRAYLYQLYYAVYEQSDIHFDLLTIDFFDAILQDPTSGGQVFLYWDQEILVGYNICYVYQDKLVDKYIGMNYPIALEHNLYFISWLINLDYAVQQKLNYYVAGWTDPEVKSQLGAEFTFTQHLVWISRPWLRLILKPIKFLFEADAHWYQNNKNNN